MGSISVFVADDHDLVREGLKSLIENSDQLSHVGEAATLDAIIPALDRQLPDILLLDVEFPEGKSFTTCAQIKDKFPTLKVLILTGISSKEIVNECLLSEADGFLLKGVKYNELVTAIRDVMAGRSIMDPHMLE